MRRMVGIGLAQAAATAAIMGAIWLVAPGALAGPGRFAILLFLVMAGVATATLLFAPPRR